MEGLIPMVYKSVKKSKTRRQYECLSSGAAHQPYGSKDLFYTKNDDHHAAYFSREKHLTAEIDGVRGVRHRRSNSAHVDHLRGFGSSLEKDGYRPNKQLVRFQSNKMFLCLTGG